MSGLNDVATQIPDRGDVIWLSADPSAGRMGPAGNPVVVVSPAAYNERTGRALCVPIRSCATGYPFEVELPAGFPVRGVAVADQVKCLDWRARFASPIASLPPTVVAQLMARARALLE